MHCQCMHCRCIVDALSTHCRCIVFALSMHCLCIVYALSTHCLCIVFALSTHCLCIVYSLPMHCRCIVYALSLHCLTSFWEYLLPTSCSTPPTLMQRRSRCMYAMATCHTQNEVDIRESLAHTLGATESINNFNAMYRMQVGVRKASGDR